MPTVVECIQKGSRLSIAIIIPLSFTVEVWRQCVKAGSWTRHCRAPTLTLKHTCVLFGTTPGSMLFGTTQELGAHQSRFQLIRCALRQVRHHVAHALVALAHVHFLGGGDILQVLYTLHHVTHLCASINKNAKGLTTLIACTISQHIKPPGLSIHADTYIVVALLILTRTRAYTRTYTESHMLIIHTQNTHARERDTHTPR